jgi:hypothetical protein
MLKKGDAGEPDKMFTGGVGSLYRVESYDGTWYHGERFTVFVFILSWHNYFVPCRTGTGIIKYLNGDTVEGTFVNGQPHGYVIYFFAKSKRRRQARYHFGYRLEWLEEVKRKRQIFEMKRKSPSPPPSSASRDHMGSR